jgi:hypothetical protein
MVIWRLLKAGAQGLGSLPNKFVLGLAVHKLVPAEVFLRSTEYFLWILPWLYQSHSSIMLGTNRGHIFVVFLRSSKNIPRSYLDYSATARFRIVSQFLIHKMTHRRSLPSRGLRRGVWGRSLAGIVGSNPARGTDVSLSCECRQVEVWWVWCVWLSSVATITLQTYSK